MSIFDDKNDYFNWTFPLLVIFIFICFWIIVLAQTGIIKPKL